jgi:hypothetical protein
MPPEEFMSEPAKVLKEFIQLSRSSEGAYQLGCLGMALEIITRIKLLESLPITTEVGRQEAITVLQTMLTELGISDLAYEWYERLSEWRRPKFVRADAFEQQLEHALPSDADGGPLRPGPRTSSALASDDGARRDVLALPAGTDESDEGRPSPSLGSDATAS